MRLLFTSNPLHGHLHPMLALARAARDAGHELAFSTGPDLVERIRGFGFAAEPAGRTAEAIRQEFNARYPDSDARPAAERLLMVPARLFVDIASRGRVADLQAHARALAPDVVVHEPSEVAGAIVAAQLGVPSVTHGWGPRVPHEAYGEFPAAVEALGAEHGVAGIAAAITSAPYVDPCPPSLHFTLDDGWADVHPMRHEDPPPAPGDALPALLRERPAADAVYVTLGTVVNDRPDVFAAVLAGLRDVREPIVVTVGPGVDPAVLGAQPPHVHVARFIPQALLLPRCRAVIAHAGAGTMLGALAHGVPQLLLPHGADQHLNAAACAHAGAAEVLAPEAITADAVREAFRRLGDAHAAAARRLAGEIAAMPPAREALGGLLAAIGIPAGR